MQNNIIGLLKHLAQLVSQSSKEAVTPALGQQIRDNRDAIIECLRAQRAFDAPIAPQHHSVGPLSSSQSGLWFIEQYEQDSHLYNMPVFFRLTGELDVAALEFAFDALVDGHQVIAVAALQRLLAEADRQTEQLTLELRHRLPLADLAQRTTLGLRRTG